MKKDTALGVGTWVDLSGLICPYQALDNLLKSIENNATSSLEEVNSALVALHKNYYNYEWTWVLDVLGRYYCTKPEEFIAEDVIAIVKKWKKSVLQIDRLLYEDARKEFSLTKMTGFGVDGQNGERELDFAHVRGEFEKNETVKAIKVHMETKKTLGNELIGRMKKTIAKRMTINQN